MARWQFWIDRGGTFTDVVARAPDGAQKTLKLLSDDPLQYADAAVEGIRRILGLRRGELISPARVASVKMGTTIATNALLERRGERVVLVTTRGFRDALRIATQARPRLFDRRIVLPEMLYAHVLEAHERIGAAGDIVMPLDAAALAVGLRKAHDAGIRACAIVFVHGYRFPVHELAAQAIARRIGFTQISVSHRVSPVIKFVPRGDTTVVDAYLSPILERYAQSLCAQMPGVRLLFMQSSGGLTEAGSFHGKDAILSGPAGGIVGMVRTAERAGHRRLIGFDMGGTSTDVSHYAGRYERTFDSEVGGVRVRAPMMNIHTIAAGGGSVIRFDGARLRVGPESAGANPGPACYRRGGPLTITDANVLLGRIQPAYFPSLFGPQADQPLDADGVRDRFTALAREMTGSLARPVSPEAVAAGSVQIAVGSMANAVKRISVARGYDVTRYTLQCFGGAGGQHACLVADALGLARIFCHSLAGVLSAVGMGMADQSALREESLECPLDSAGVMRARAAATRLAGAARDELRDQGVDGEIRELVQVHVRYAGTDTALPCELAAAEIAAAAAATAIREEFDRSYRQRFGFLMPELPLVIETVSVECSAQGDTMTGVDPCLTDDATADAIGDATAYAGTHATAGGRATRQAAIASAPVSIFCFADEEPAGWRPAGLYRRETLRGGAVIEGPAIIVDQTATTVIEPGWQALASAAGDLELTRVRPRAAAGAGTRAADPVMLEIFNNLFMNIAEQMGLRLQNTSHSVNIKERLDFSCAVFDAAGALIANAPHMPVHLGSMSESVRSVMERNPDMRAGDVYALNDPYHGGTHLPDVTVVTPVYLAGGRPAFFVASRGHHADMGGVTPGSMPPFSTDITEEGVLIDNFPLVSAGGLNEAALRELLTRGPHPARNPSQNLADLRAQIAANEKGAEELRLMVAEFGHDTVSRYMQHVQDNAEHCVRAAIAALHGGEFTLDLDNGARIQVAVRVDPVDRSACIDFTGTSAQLPNNFNAPRAITVAAVLYVFRTLVDDDIPLNAGCLKPLDIIVPEGSMLNPLPPAAVVAGNVETSTCVTNALYGALGLMAASQCTMNNFTFGNARHQYYETIAGGSGAGPGFAGTAVVQTHMTNSRLTDPEVLEGRHPVRVDSFEIRAGSGGAGRWRGGDGGVRRIRFLEPMTAAILSNGRLHGAFGMAGGQAGECGRNSIEHADGRVDPLGATGQVEVAAGDVFVISTPGGGGYGIA
jgi:5-oxoprolinase (ATP-hydrolysing)